MNLEWSEDLLMVRDSVARLGQNILSHRAEIGDRSNTAFDMGPLTELGLDWLTWDESDRLMTLVALLELARWDVTSTLACLNSILGRLLGGGSGLGVMGQDRRGAEHRDNHITWAGVTSFFGGSEFAFGNGVFWKVLGETSPEELGALGLRGANPRRAVADVELIGENAHASSLLYSALAASFSGVARAALNAGHSYSMERVQFGKRIADFQGSQFKLAEMATRVEASELLVLNTTKNPSFAPYALAMARDTCLYVTDEAVQLHGGYGYTSEYEVERHFRDARFMAGLFPS